MIAGAIVSVFMGISMVIAAQSEGHIDNTTGMVIGFSAMLISFSFIFIGIKSLRDKQLGGTITFGKGLQAGLLIAFIASTMYVIMWAFEYNLVMPDFMEKYSASMIEAAKASGKPQAEIDEAIASILQGKENYKNPVFFTLYTYAEILPIGILVALVSAAILRRKPKAPVMA